MKAFMSVYMYKKKVKCYYLTLLTKHLIMNACISHVCIIVFYLNARIGLQNRNCSLAPLWHCLVAITVYFSYC